MIYKKKKYKRSDKLREGERSFCMLVTWKRKTYPLKSAESGRSTSSAVFTLGSKDGCSLFYYNVKWILTLERSPLYPAIQPVTGEASGYGHWLFPLFVTINIIRVDFTRTIALNLLNETCFFFYKTVAEWKKSWLHFVRFLNSDWLRQYRFILSLK